MRIPRLRINNFRLHLATDFCPGPQVNLFSGPEGQGKTTIAAAIEFACRRVCGDSNGPWVADNGAGADDLIRSGEKKAVIGVSLEHRGQTMEFEQTQPPASGIREFMQGLHDFLGVSTLMLEACLRPVRFFELSDDKQRSILWALLGELTDDEYRSKLNDYSPEIKTLGDYYFDTLKPTMAFIKDPQKHIKEQLLRDANRRVEDLERKLNDSPPHNPSEMWNQEQYESAKAELKAVTDRIAGYAGDRKRLDEWQTAKDAFDVAMSSHNNELDTLTAEKVVLSEYQACLAGYPPIENQELTLTELRTEVMSMKEALSELEHETVVTGEQTCLEKGKKVLCVREKLMSQTRAISDLRTAIEEKTTEGRELAGHIKATRDLLGDIERQAACIRDQEADLDLWTAPTDPGSEPAVNLGDLEDLVRQQGELSHTVERLNSLKTQIDQASNTAYQRSNWEQELQTQKTLQLYLSTLAEALGSSGVRAQIMETKVAGFLEEVNAHLCPNGDPKNRIAPPLALNQVEWKWFTVIKGKQVPIHMASDSQKIRQCLAIVVSIALRTGLNVVTADRMESMHPNTLVSVIAWLRSLPIQSFLFRTSQEVNPETRQAIRPDEFGPSYFSGPGVTEWWVEGGSVRPMKAAVGVTA